MLFYLTLVYLFHTVAMAKQGRHRNEISHDGNYIIHKVKLAVNAVKRTDTA